MIAIENLTFSYRRKETVFRKLNLELPQGHIYGLFGKNGAGKSTLLKSMCGLLFPREGSCKIAGYEAKRRRPGMLQEVFIVPEEFYLPEVSMENYIRTYAPFYPSFDPQEFEIYLSEFDILPSAHLGRLSYGQKKKVLISFALAANTTILLLDEPTNGLDIPSKSIFRKLVASAFHEDRTVLISTHQVRDLDNLIDTMIILHEQEIAVKASIDHILSKIAFHVVPETNFQENDDMKAGIILYGENSLKGRDVIVENKDGELTKMNIELFFRAVTEDPEKIRALLN